LNATAESPWCVVLTELRQELQNVWRLHELGLELYVPIVRERRATKKKDVHGRKIVVLHPRPMFPGYGFLRTVGRSMAEIEGVRGVNRILRYGATANICLLPHSAIMDIRNIEIEKHREMLRAKGRPVSRFKRGDLVRVDNGSVYTGLTAHIDSIDAKGRVELLFGMIRHWIPADMVVAA